ncbi:MAG TPA: hypothetical protein VGF55_23085 [Gemmataceae bacterium]|jgi:hypothetical protein
MRSTLLRLAGLATLLASEPAFGQGLGLTPAVPDGASALTVTPQAGPWLICAASYSGPPSRGQAEELANEIRGRYHLPAYVFNRTAEERRQEKERVERLREEHRKRLELAGLPPDTPVHIRTVRIEDQYAVLVGGYKDDVTARKELDRIRTLKPASDDLNHQAYVPDAKGVMHVQAVNPFRSAFVCRNPSVPVEKPKQDDDLDARLKKYNASEPYSLLKSSKPFTLVVKAYKGAARLQSQSATSSVMQKMGMDREFGNVLNANANQAHQVAEFLRKFGVEAYVLHTEYNSYVTVGGFDAPDDPRLAQMQQWFVAEMANPKSNIGQLHTVAMVQFYTEPMPMAVPQVR